jgi:hypothetical protein
MLLAACPFDVVRDDTQKPANTLLVSNGAVFLAAPVPMKVECDVSRVRLNDELLIEPISFRLTQPLQLTLEVPKPAAAKGDLEARRTTWARWLYWVERVRSLRRNSANVSFGERDGGTSEIDALRAYIIAQQSQVSAEATQVQTQRHEQLKPFKFGSVSRIGTMVSGDPEFVFWSRNQLCVVQGEKAAGKTVRCYDPKTSKWSAKAPRERWPKDAVTVLRAGTPRADGVLYRGECSFQRGQDAWHFEELGLRLNDMPDDDVSASANAKAQFDEDCAGCPGMMCAREQECREREMSQSSVGISCPDVLAVSADGSSMAFSVNVVRRSMNCWANGYRCAEDTSEPLRTLLVLVPVQR